MTTCQSPAPGLARLLQAIAVHRDEAWTQLDRDVGPRLWALCQRITGSAAEADDALQDAYLRIDQSAPRFKAQEKDPDASAWSWCQALTVRAAVDICRSRSVRRRHLQHAERAAESSVEAHPGSRLERSELAEELRSALAHLPLQQRLPIMLHLLQGISYLDMAGQLQAPTNTLKVRVHRGLAHLRQRLSTTRRAWSLSLGLGLPHGSTTSTVARISPRGERRSWRWRASAAGVVLGLLVVLVNASGPVPHESGSRFPAVPPKVASVLAGTAGSSSGPGVHEASISERMAQGRRALRLASERGLPVQTMEEGKDFLGGGSVTTSSLRHLGRDELFTNRCGDARLDAPALVSRLARPCTFTRDQPTLGACCQAISASCGLVIDLDRSLDQNRLPLATVGLERLSVRSAAAEHVVDCLCRLYQITWAAHADGIVLLAAPAGIPLHAPVELRSALPHPPAFPRERMAYASVITATTFSIEFLFLMQAADSVANYQEIALDRNGLHRDFGSYQAGYMGGYLIFMADYMYEPLPTPIAHAGHGSAHASDQRLTLLMAWIMTS